MGDAVSVVVWVMLCVYPSLLPLVGVFNVVTGPGSFGQMIATHPGVDKVAFTGSTQVTEGAAREHCIMHFLLSCLHLSFLP